MSGRDAVEADEKTMEKKPVRERRKASKETKKVIEGVKKRNLVWNWGHNQAEITTTTIKKTFINI